MGFHEQEGLCSKKVLLTMVRGGKWGMFSGSPPSSHSVSLQVKQTKTTYNKKNVPSDS